MTYQETVSWLFEQFPAYHNLGSAAYNPGLKNIQALADFFGNPQQNIRFVHIAGTNGKGSVSNMTASILTEAGERVGLFTSPHLFDFTERIRVNGKPVDETFVIDFCTQVRTHTWEIQPSFFEITWMMALVYFKQQNCSIVIAEVGLGGRLDATNIITPLISVITNISLEHTNLLGSTRAEIAGEKGGIIKSNIPVVLGEKDAETAPVFEAIIQQQHSREILAPEIIHFPKGIFGYQRMNFKIVNAVIQYLNSLPEFYISEATIQRGIDHLGINTGFHGRMEQVGQEPNVWIDCAHNAAGIRTLFENLPVSGRLFCVYGTSSDKNLDEIIPELPKNAVYAFTEFQNTRTAKIPFLEDKLANFGKERKFFSNPIEAFISLQKSANKEDTILIFGSFFLVHDFFEVFFQKTLAETK